MRTLHLAITLIGVMFMPMPALSSMTGSVACSGDMTLVDGDSTNLSCSGDLTLSDSVISDPIQIFIRARGLLTLTRSQINAPDVRLAAELIKLDDSVVASGGQLAIGGDIYVGGSSLPNSLQPPPSSSGSVTGWITLSSRNVDMLSGHSWPPSGGSITVNSGLGLPLDGPITSSGGAIQASSDPIALNVGSFSLIGARPTLISGSITLSGGNSGTPPVSLIPEPSAALLLAAGLGVIMLRRQMKTGSR
ncbi:MAG: PEP-CTERM sorting domain-containing protein [Pseudomonadota bacterium]